MEPLSVAAAAADGPNPAAAAGGGGAPTAAAAVNPGAALAAAGVSSSAHVMGALVGAPHTTRVSAVVGSCLKTGQHLFFVIIYLLLPIKCIIFYSVSKILFKNLLLPIIMIRLMKILLHNVYKITNK